MRYSVNKRMVMNRFSLHASKSLCIKYISATSICTCIMALMLFSLNPAIVNTCLESMANFRPHYTLCPLLGPHNLVGVSSDKEHETVLVTLGPNIVVKHKLADQKPLKSWSTRQSNPLTCHCVYDAHRDKYIGVINSKHVCEWNEDEANLEDVKKKTFSTNIHSIHTPVGKPAIVVFANGYIENLESAIVNRKTEKPSLLEAGETLSKSYLECVKDQVILVLFTDTNKVYYVRQGKDGTPEGNLSFTLQKQTDEKVIGKTIVNDGQNICVLALWSDGELIQYSEQGTATANHVVNGISLSSPVALVKLDATHIAIYGADSSDEGALLLLYDLKFGMTMAMRRLKFFCNPPLLYCPPNNNVLLLCVVQNLVVVPFNLQPSLLWNLVDKKQTSEARLEPELVSWDEKKEAPKVTPRTNNLTFRTAELTRQADSLCRSNAPNSRIFDELLPKLKEDGDVDRICVLLKRFKDLPEEWLADLLNFFLEQPQFDKVGRELNTQRAQQLAILLSTPYSDVVLLGYIRKKLVTKSTIKLLQHLSVLLQDCGLQQETEADKKPTGPNVNQIVDWIALILDAHHNELLIAGTDEEIRRLIDELKQLVKDYYDFLDGLGDSEALISLLQRNKKPPANRRNDWYAIEVVRLF